MVIYVDLAKTFGLDKKTVHEIAKDVANKMQKVNEILIKPYNIHFSNKNLSEIIGKIMEKSASDILSKKLGYEVKNAKSDSDPDLVFVKTGKKIEIKVTSTENGWTGGEFSKRPFEYLLISWGGNFDEFFVAFVHLEKDEWHSNMSKNYYGPNYSAKDLHKKKDKIIFLGRLEVTERGAIKIKRENLFNKKII